MKTFFLIILLPAFSFSLFAQDNKQRAESLASMATQKEASGATYEEFNLLFKQALELSPDYAELYILWGAIIAKHAEKKDDPELMSLSFGKFEKSIRLKSDQDARLLHSAYTAWAAGLAFQAMKTEDESILPLCYEKFGKAIEFKPDNYQTYQQWGGILLEQAKKKKDILQFQETIDKYNKALEIEPNSLSALLGKGYAYLCMGRYGQDFLKYRSQLEAAYVRAEQLGGQSAAYNLACYYSLIKDKDEAFKWLEKAILKQTAYTQRMSVLDKDRINADEDFNNIRHDKRYRKLLDRYFEN